MHKEWIRHNQNSEVMWNPPDGTAFFLPLPFAVENIEFVIHYGIICCTL